MPTFQPPSALTGSTTLRKRHEGNKLLRHFGPWRVGRTVLKSTLGVYTTVDIPTVDQIAAAAAVYQGGHVYTVTDAEAAALTAAGYGSGLS